MPKGDARLSFGGPLINGSPVRDGWLSPPISSPAASLCLALREITRQSGNAAGGAVDIPIDGLRADAVVDRVQLHPPRNLFRGPPHGKAVSDIIAKVGEALDLRAAQFTHPGHPIGAVRSILGGAAIAGDLPIDRSAVPAKPAGNLTNFQAHFHQAAQAASLVQ